MASQFTQVHSTKKFRLMTRKTDVAGNEYLYAKGVASLADGDFVTVTGAGVTARSLDTLTGIIAVAQAAVTSTTTYGWFMVKGRDASANVATHSSGIGKALFLSSTAGRGTTTPATEKTAYGAFSDGDSVANVGPVFLSYPVAPGDIST